MRNLGDCTWGPRELLRFCRQIPRIVTTSYAANASQDDLGSCLGLIPLRDYKLVDGPLL